MLRIIGTLIGTAMVQFRVPSNRERERGRGKERRVVHTEANLITKYGCQILAESFHPVHVRACLCESERERENAAERRGESTLFNGSALSKPSLRNALFLGIKFFVIPPPPPSVTGRSIGDVPIQ